MPSLEVQLRIAAEQGDLPKVQELLAAGAHPDGVRESNGRTPLYRAANRDHQEIVRLLLERGADPNREAGIHGTAMGTAKSHAVVRLLQAHGATQEHHLPPGECTLCGGDIDFVAVVGRWRFGRWLEGRCPTCGIRYGATSDRGELTPWYRREIPREWLVAPLLPEGVEALSERIRKHSSAWDEWQKFLDDRKPGDQVWRYEDPSDSSSGVVLMRGEVSIATFSP
jgi:hypothetical protein